MRRPIVLSLPLQLVLPASRYIAVCAPFFRLRHNIKARFYILPILLFAPLYNVPRFFEFRAQCYKTFYGCYLQKFEIS
jgi:hypothetical protein